MPGRKGEKGLLLVGHEKVPHGFGLTGDCGSHTADGAGSLNHGLTSTSFPEIRYPRLARGRGKDCPSVGILEDFSINEDIKSLLLSLCNFKINNFFPFHQSLALRDVFPLAAGISNLLGVCVVGEPPERERGDPFYNNILGTTPRLFCNISTFNLKINKKLSYKIKVVQ